MLTGSKCEEIVGQGFGDEGLLESIGGRATHGELDTEWEKWCTGHPDVNKNLCFAKRSRTSDNENGTFLKRKPGRGNSRDMTQTVGFEVGI